MRDRPKTKSQRKAQRLDAEARAAAVAGGASTLGLGQAADRLGTIGTSGSIL